MIKLIFCHRFVIYFILICDRFWPGSLLCSVQPELMDTLIQASKDGDDSKLQASLSEDTLSVEEEDVPEEEELLNY